MVDVDASAILRDLHEKPEKDIESRLDASIPATQTHLRDRIGMFMLVSVSAESTLFYMFHIDF